MTANKFILIFLGLIFLVIVILSSNRIGNALRARFGKYIPPMFGTVSITMTPTPSPAAPNRFLPSPTATPTPALSRNVTGSTPTTEIPATGPENLVWLILGGSLLGGALIRGKSSTSSGKKI